MGPHERSADSHHTTEPQHTHSPFPRHTPPYDGADPEDRPHRAVRGFLRLHPATRRAHTLLRDCRRSARRRAFSSPAIGGPAPTETRRRTIPQANIEPYDSARLRAL